MKKYMFLLIVFFITFSLFGQSNLSIINELIVAIETNIIPQGFQRQGRTTYIKQTYLGTAALIVENNSVVFASIGTAYETTHEAWAGLSIFYDILEDIGTFLYEIREGDIYSIRSTFAFIYKPVRREDNLIAAGVFFSKNINDF